ncbi:hypothetical protein JIM94_006545, partial [Corynebacterium sp. CCM 8836]|nr:hypothetical protein [Corynebacterium pygosceleis]
MTLHFDLEQLEQIIESLREQQKKSSSIHNQIIFRPRIELYSLAPGLSELGQQHAQVFTGAVGSAREVLMAFREQAEWLVLAMHSMKETFSATETVNNIQIRTGFPSVFAIDPGDIR